MHPRESVFRRSLLVVVVYGMAVALALAISSSMDDPDLWWHLRTGQWMVQHRALPDAELFSAHHAHERWVAYSWAYDLVVYAFHRAFGLFGPVVLSGLVALLIARALFRLLCTISGRAAFAAALAGVGLVAMAPMLYGRSTMFTIWFALLEIHLLWRALVLGETRKLALVPLVLVAWANVHVQFVYGLAIYACFAGQALVDARKSFGAWALAGCACLAATLVNPYGLRIYEPLLQYMEQSRTIYALLEELHPPSFATFDTWIALAIVVAVVVGVARRPVRKPFLLLLFAVAIVVGFRSARDVWFFVATGLPLLAAAIAGAREEVQEKESPALVAIGVLLVAGAASAAVGISGASLRERLALHVPVAASEFVETRAPGPIFNPYDWGGWLLWRLPDREIAIDGRTWVHRADYIERSYRTWNAMPGWEDDPDLAAAAVVLGPRDQPLTSALSGDPRFERVYQDAIACVYVRLRN
jgi:hypothetical protein